MSFEFDIPEKDIAAVDFMGTNHKTLLKAALKARDEKGLTQRQVAELLEVDKSVISRALSGRSNLTERTIGELCWALGYEPRLVLTDLSEHVTNVTAQLEQITRTLTKTTNSNSVKAKKTKEYNSFNLDSGTGDAHRGFENAS